jgi:hypothetical protein
VERDGGWDWDVISEAAYLNSLPFSLLGWRTILRAMPMDLQKRLGRYVETAVGGSGSVPTRAGHLSRQNHRFR